MTVHEPVLYYRDDTPLHENCVQVQIGDQAWEMNAEAAFRLGTQLVKMALELKKRYLDNVERN